MTRAALVIAVVWASSAARAAEPVLAPGHWELGAGLGSGAIDFPYLFVGYLPRADLRVQARALYAWSDRLHLRAFLPAAEYRLGDPARGELRFHGGVLAASVLDEQFLYQSPQDAIALASGRSGTPRALRGTFGLGGTLRLANPVRSWSFSLEASTTRSLQGRPQDLPFFTASVAAGVTLLLTERLSVHVALSLENSAALLPDLVHTVPVLAIGSVQHVGLRRPPLVRWKLNDTLFLDADAGAWIGVSGRAEALAGITWIL